MKCMCYNVFVAMALIVTKEVVAHLPTSPCRSIFTYKTRNDTGEAYGYLLFPNDRSGDYQLEIRMSIAKETNDSIIIFRVPSEDDIQCGKDLEYEVYFPHDDVIPTLALVKYNRKIYCTGLPPRGTNRKSVTHLLENNGFVTNMRDDCEDELESEDFVSYTSQAKEDGCGILEENKDKDRPRREYFPWVATLFHIQPNNNNKNSYICSGTLITNSHIVTVAHHIHNLTHSEILVRLGSNNIKTILSSSQTITRKVRSIRIYPGYDPALGPRGRNIALLKLTEIVEFSDLIRPLCLWTGSKKLDDIVGKEGIVIGWGADAKPRKFVMPIVSRETCLHSHAKFKHLLDSSNFCAGNRDGLAPCFGNSGGSLAIKKEDNRYYLRGLASAALKHENGTCDGHQYNLFTDAAQFGKWITSNAHDIDVSDLITSRFI